MLIVPIKMKTVILQRLSKWERSADTMEQPSWLLIFSWSDGLVLHDSHTPE